MRKKIPIYVCVLSAALYNTRSKRLNNKKMAASSSASESGERLEKRQPDEEFSWFGGKPTYHCYWNKFQRPGLGALAKWKFATKNNSNIPLNKPELLDKYMPVKKLDRERLENPPKDKVQVTWIGHATVLVQFDGISILSDPIFRNFCGPEKAETFKSLGYQRYRKAAGNSGDIPKIDVVIISHNHYDHLDKGSVKEIHKNHPHVTWFVPKNTREWFLGEGVGSDETIVEMTWWEEYPHKVGDENFKFICTPSQHWCQRGATDLNKMLWASWVVQGPKHSYFFAGDTGYHKPLFQTIGQDYGPFSVAAIPIGAYEPREITKYQHVNPDEAVEIHGDVRSEQSIGIHWGAFEVTNEFFLEPPNKVKELMQNKGLDHEKFLSLSIGETWTVGERREDSPFMGICKKVDMRPGPPEKGKDSTETSQNKL